MKRILYVLLVVTAFASCAESYSVQGSSSISQLDGNKLYLKAIKDQELKILDSCEVVHGQFRFAGLLDTVRLASLYMDDESIMPVVLEKGEISIKIDNAQQTVGGTPLNDKLFEFLSRHNQLGNQLSELQHKENQMVLDGIDEDTIRAQIIQEAALIAAQEDSLVMGFIEENFDNVLGPGVFMMITSSYPYPMLTPQIEHIMSKATPKFKSDPFVRDYYRAAQEVQARQSGLDTPADQAIQQQQQLQQPPVQQPPLQQSAPLTNVPLDSLSH